MPLPQFSEDDFLNFCVVEALSLKSAVEEQNAHEAAKREEWKRKPLGSD